MSQQLTIQYEMLMELERFLIAFSTRNDESVQEFKIQIASMFENGLPQEVLAGFENNFLKQIESLVLKLNEINSEAIGYSIKVRNNVEEAITNAKSY